MGCRARDVNLCHFLCIAVGGVGELKADIETLCCGLYVQVAIFERGIRETVPEGIGWDDLLLVIPTVTYKVLFCIVGDELLKALVAAIAGEIDKDIALGVILNVLWIGASGISWYIFQLLGPRHWQFARWRNLTREDFGERLTAHRAVEPGGD